MSNYNYVANSETNLHNSAMFYKNCSYDKNTESSTSGKVKPTNLAKKQIITSDLSSKSENSIRALSARTVNTLATNGYHNSLQILGLLRPVEVFTPVKIATTFLTTFNYITGCAAAMSIPESKNSTMTPEAGTYDYASSTGVQETPGSQNSTIVTELEADSRIRQTEILTTEDSKQPTAASGITSLSDNSTIPVQNNTQPILNCENEGGFQCQEGICIDQSKVCNGKNDCAQVSDEVGCTSACGKQFDCLEGLSHLFGNECIDRNLVCDGKRDCLRTGYDEKNCHESCNEKTEFYCEEDDTLLSGPCIPKEWQCDGNIDCKLSDSDERNCNFSTPVMPTSSPTTTLGATTTLGSTTTLDSTTTPNPTITPDGFDCGVGDQNGFIDWRKRCDYIIDCKSGSDEKDCLPACNPETEFFCAQDVFVTRNVCIPIEWQCDGKEDCRMDDSDELNCGSPEPSVTTEETVINPCNKVSDCVEAETTAPDSTEMTSSVHPFWDSLTDYTTYLPWRTNDQEEEANKQTGISTLAIGLGIGAAGLTTALGGIVIWNAVKRREQELAKGNSIGWKRALWGGVNDLAHFKIRRTQESHRCSELEMRETTRVYAPTTTPISNSVVAVEREVLVSKKDEREIPTNEPKNSFSYQKLRSDDYG